MNMTITISQWGLILDIIGVLLLFKYGLPSPIEDEEGDIVIFSHEGHNKDEIKKKNRRIRIFANVGLTLIFLGFVLQFIGSGKSS